MPSLSESSVSLLLLILETLLVVRLSQTKQAYRCFCSPKRLDQMRQEFRRSGSNLTYDRKCLQMSDAEQARRLSEGTSHVVRLRVCSQSPSTLLPRKHTPISCVAVYSTFALMMDGSFEQDRTRTHPSPSTTWSTASSPSSTTPRTT